MRKPIKYTPYIIIDVFQNPDRPNAMGFIFEAEDGTQISGQQLIDALSEYLLMNEPDILFAAHPDEMH